MNWRSYLPFFAISILLALPVHALTTEELARADQARQAGLSLEKEGRYEEALPFFQQAQSIAPGDDFFRMYVASCLEHLGRYEQVLQLLAHSPTEPRFYSGFDIHWIKALTALKRFDEALHMCDCLTVGSPDGKPFAQMGQPFGNDLRAFKAHLFRSEIYRGMNRPQDAVKEAQMAYYDAVITPLRDVDKEEAAKVLASLNAEVPKELKPIDTENDKFLSILDRLMSLTSPPSKQQLESILSRPFFDTDSRVGLVSSDGSRILKDICYGRSEQVQNRIELIATIDCERVAIEKLDLDVRYDQSHSSPTRTALCSVIRPQLTSFHSTQAWWQGPELHITWPAPDAGKGQL